LGRVGSFSSHSGSTTPDNVRPKPTSYGEKAKPPVSAWAGGFAARAAIVGSVDFDVYQRSNWVRKSGLEQGGQHASFNYLYYRICRFGDRRQPKREGGKQI
jgi:hypothetical protein